MFLACDLANLPLLFVEMPRPDGYANTGLEQTSSLWLHKEAGAVRQDASSPSAGRARSKGHNACSQGLLHMLSINVDAYSEAISQLSSVSKRVCGLYTLCATRPFSPKQTDRQTTPYLER